MSTCKKPHIRYLLKCQESDYRSVFGRNVRNICKEAEAETISKVCLSKLSYKAIPNDEEWRVPLVLELLELRSGRLESILTKEEILTLLNEVTTD